MRSRGNYASRLKAQFDIKKKLKVLGTIRPRISCKHAPRCMRLLVGGYPTRFFSRTYVS